MFISAFFRSFPRFPLWGLFTLAVLFVSCSNSEVSELQPEFAHHPMVTYMATVNGLGDNGYNDDAVKGVFRFVEKTDARISLLLPHDTVEARNMFETWLEDNENRDSTILIVGSSSYVDMVRAHAIRLHGKGARVLLFESKDTIPGAYTVTINRYGASYLCGAMAKDYEALIMVAMKGIDVVDDAVQAFQLGHDRHAENYRNSCNVIYLANDERGFAMPDSAYRTLTAFLRQRLPYQGIVFPLLGGSEVGVVRAMNDMTINPALFIGMDVDQSRQSKNTPYSMVVHIGDVLYDHLYDWYNGKEWPQTRMFGLADKAINVVINGAFLDRISSFDNPFTELETTITDFYDSFINEAIKEEEEHN